MPYLRAATDNPFGAIPYDEVKRITAYNKDAAAARIFPGDFVILEADGGVAPSTAAADRPVGVAAMGSPASTAEANFLVYDHPDQRFTIQDDSDTSAVDQTSVGANCDIAFGAGDTTLDRSAHEIDSSTVLAASGQLRLVELHEIEGGSFATAAGQPRKWIVYINEHRYRSEAGI